MNFDDFNYDYGGHAYVWAKPKSGDWNEAIYDHFHGRGDSNWRPARLIGHCTEEQDKGSQLDGRRLEFIGQSGTFRLDNFECGGQLVMEDTQSMTPAF